MNSSITNLILKPTVEQCDTDEAMRYNSTETYTNYLDIVDIDRSCQNRNMPHEFGI